MQSARRVTGARLIVGTFVAMIGFAAVVGAGTATADSGLTVCTGPKTGTIVGNVTVPAGATCTLQTALVTGNISTQPGSFLAVVGGVTVSGSIAGAPSTVEIERPSPRGPNTIRGNVTGGQMICGAVLGGNVTMSGNTSKLLALGGTESDAACRNVGGGNRITGNVTVSGNAPPFFRVADNQVGGSVIIKGTSGTGRKLVLHNSIRGVLSCLGNAQPFVASGNLAAVSVGQCAA